MNTQFNAIQLAESGRPQLFRPPSRPHLATVLGYLVVGNVQVARGWFVERNSATSVKVTANRPYCPAAGRQSSRPSREQHLPGCAGASCGLLSPNFTTASGGLAW